jgi:hypothetical protein
MSLAFALMAAINGSAGSSARLTYGLNGTKPHRRQPDGDTILTAPGRRRQAVRDTDLDSPCCDRFWAAVVFADDRPTGDEGLPRARIRFSVGRGWVASREVVDRWQRGRR